MTEECEKIVREGKDFFENGNYRDAVESFKAAREINQNDFTILYYLGGSAFMDANLELAREALECAIHCNPQNAEAHFDLGLVLEKCGAHTEAEAEYAQVLKIDNGHVDAMHHLGIVQLENGHAAESVESLKSASRNRSDDMNIHFDLGRAYIATGSRKFAMRERQIIELVDAKLGEQLANLIALNPSTQNAQNITTGNSSSDNTDTQPAQNSYNPFG